MGCPGWRWDVCAPGFYGAKDPCVKQPDGENLQT